MARIREICRSKTYSPRRGIDEKVQERKYVLRVCGTTHDDETVVASIEHIVPYGIDGSDRLTITICRESNNDLGSEVDAPFMDFFPVRSKRFFLGLESTKGNPPTLDLNGHCSVA